MVESGQPLDQKITKSQLEKLAQAKIYFAHMSVGFNIIDGIEDILRDNNMSNLKLVESLDPTQLENAVFCHSRVEQNGVPTMKLQNFEKNINAGIGDKAELAGLKFCYVDFTPKTNVQKLFADYKSTMDKLKRAYPKTRFFHVTAPLQAREEGIKALIKRLIGKTLRGTTDNLKREQYNALIRSEYGGKEPLFDLAAIESTAKDGSRLVYESEGRRYSALRKQYTDDGSHLNLTGRKIVAEQFLIFLSGLL